LPEILREQLGTPHGLVQVLLDGAFLATRIPVPGKQALWVLGQYKTGQQKSLKRRPLPSSFNARSAGRLDQHDAMHNTASRTRDIRKGERGVVRIIPLSPWR
jgi:hypothetical protein